MGKKFLVTLLFTLVISQVSVAQQSGRLSGNFQIDAQLYQQDSMIGAVVPDERMGLNSYANLRYDQAGFSAGLRFEGYLNTLQGFDPGYDGVGIPYYFLRYHTDKIDLTAGDYYEQFGTGILLRTWEDKNLGVDNALRGIRVRFSPLDGVSLTGVVGKQRNMWTTGPGLVRGLDGNVSLNELWKVMADQSFRIDFGGSFVSKYQADDDPIYVLPENVGAWSSRMNLSAGAFRIETEYAHKINDPTADNNFIYKTGEALILNASYAISGLGVNVTAKRVDNMAFRSDRSENLTKLMIGYLPPISKSYTYRLMNIYPYASQPNGEMGLQGEISYNIRRSTRLGGKYGMQITGNFSMVNSIDKQPVDPDTPIGANGTLGYQSDFFKLGDEKFYRDYNVEISRKLSKKWKVIGLYQHLLYNQLVMEGKGDLVQADLAVLDVTWKPVARQALRFETQGLWTQDDKGSWAMFMLEYTISPNWFFSVVDQYNYGNPDEAHRIHYLAGSVGYVHDAFRIQAGYGKQREGILCVGGVCRNVPAMNGFSLSITSSF